MFRPTPQETGSILLAVGFLLLTLNTLLGIDEGAVFALGVMLGLSAAVLLAREGEHRQNWDWQTLRMFLPLIVLGLLAIWMWHLAV